MTPRNQRSIWKMARKRQRSERVPPVSQSEPNAATSHMRAAKVRSGRKFAIDQAYWSLAIKGPMTCEQLAVWMGRGVRQVKACVGILRRLGLVEPFDSQWRVLPEIREKEFVAMGMPQQKPGRSKQDYSTPADFITAAKHRLAITEFAFDFAADARNMKATRFWSKADDSLSKSAEEWASQCRHSWGWLNPEFADINPWSQRCWQTKQLGGAIALLVPASVGANWFKHFVHGKALVLFLNGRLAFIEGKPDDLYPKDCILCLYAPELAPGYQVWTWKKQLERRAA